MMAFQYLEDFNSDKSSIQSIRMSEELDEAGRLLNFEAGYKAGWDDATLALSNESKDLANQINQRLHDVRFTFHEAYAHLLGKFEPFIIELIDKMLPDMFCRGLSILIKNEVESIARDVLPNKIIIMLAESNFDHMEEILKKELSSQYTIAVDPNLTDGQLYLRLGESERLVDIKMLANSITELLSNFMEQQKGNSANG